MRTVIGYRVSGGVLLTEDEYIQVKNNYIMMYQSSDLLEMFEKLDKSRMNVLMYLVKNTDTVPNGEFNVGSLFMERYASYRKTLGLTPYTTETVRHALKDLVDAGAIYRISRGIYVLNPVHFYIGDPALREKRITEVTTMAAKHKCKDVIDEHNKKNGL